MKIMLVHNRYKIWGGEDTVFDAERELLQSNGNEVYPLIVDNDSIKKWTDKISAAVRLSGTNQKRQALEHHIKIFRPDVIHVHNFFPLITPSIFDACDSLGVPSVMTIHNFRPICAGALLLRDGKVCEKCVQGSPYWGAYHRCYRGSLVGSLAVARMISNQRHRGAWNDRVTRFIALTEFAKSKLVEGGLPESKIVVKPNFVASRAPEENTDAARHGALYVGRLSPEKGLHVLLDAWRQIDYPLEIIGEGDLPIDPSVLPPNVVLRGKLSREEVAQRMQRAAFAVMPSLWYEGFPMVLLEAMSCGTPVVASRIGSLAELIEDRVTGRLVPAGDAAALSTVVREMIDNVPEREAMAKAAQIRVSERYTPQKNLEQLMLIYNGLVRDGASLASAG